MSDWENSSEEEVVLNVVKTKAVVVLDEPDSDEEREKVKAANAAAAQKAKDAPKKEKVIPMTEQERRQMKE